ncbi:MAG TPA: tail fiber domain-containing protein, partial [Bacteroidetes bacterium]|nr:tail fiber domain-containing protein [Bacteroidota bacterium]
MMKNLNKKISLLFTALTLLFISGNVMSQQIGKPQGNLINFFNTSSFGGPLAHIQSGSFSGTGGSDQWISIGRATTIPSMYGSQIQWSKATARMVLTGSGTKTLEMHWGGSNSSGNMDFKYMPGSSSTSGQLNVMRLTKQGRVGIGTTSPYGKLDVRTAATDANFYGIYSRNDRTSGAGAYHRGKRYGSYNSAGNFGTTFYGTMSGASGSGIGYGVYGIAKMDEDIAYGVYGLGIVCDGTAYGIYGTVDTCSSTATYYAGYFDGDVTVTGNFTAISDARFKKNVETETDALDKVMQLRPTTYEFDREKYSYMHLNDGLNHGFIAQEMAKVFPEMVTDNVHPLKSNTIELDAEGEIIESKDQTGKKTIEYKGINYMMMIPVLTKAIQEQQAQLDAEKAINAELAAELEVIKAQIAALQNASDKGATGGLNMNNLESNVLFQNVPNPFDANTVISYHTVKSAHNIALHIYDLHGREIRLFENLKPGKSEVN